MASWGLLRYRAPSMVLGSDIDGRCRCVASSVSATTNLTCATGTRGLRQSSGRIHHGPSGPTNVFNAEEKLVHEHEKLVSEAISKMCDGIYDGMMRTKSS